MKQSAEALVYTELGVRQACWAIMCRKSPAKRYAREAKRRLADGYARVLLEDRARLNECSKGDIVARDGVLAEYA